MIRKYPKSAGGPGGRTPRKWTQPGTRKKKGIPKTSAVKLQN